MSDHVWMRNPETGGVWACPADYVPVAEARGWEPTEAPDDSLDGLFDPATEAVEEAPVRARAGKKKRTTTTGD